MFSSAREWRHAGKSANPQAKRSSFANARRMGGPTSLVDVKVLGVWQDQDQDQGGSKGEGHVFFQAHER